MTVPRYWREIPQRYTLQASKCESCEAIYFPPRVVCPQCRRQSVDRMSPVVLVGEGTVIEATRIYKPGVGRERQVPYILALVKATEGPVLTAQIVECENVPDPGTKVMATFRRLGEDGPSGVIHYGTKWKIDPR